MRNNPVTYEINTLPWLNVLSERYGRAITLETVPEKEWEALQAKGIDCLWLMGIWKRSPAARKEAIRTPAVMDSIRAMLPQWDDSVVEGSPYAVYSYVPDPRIARDFEELGRARSTINRLGMKLILDFVPNHLAMDHPWTVDHPEYFLQATAEQAAENPGWFYQTPGGLYLAHGRDPYFAPWSDTVQINVFNESARRAMIREVISAAHYCDGFRCDMAMLLLNGIFSETWKKFIGRDLRPDAEFWPDAIGQVKSACRGTLFIAEVYWGLEARLRELGFDFTYDKGLYDKLVSGSSQDVLDYIGAQPEASLSRGVHFVENHDEKRIFNAVEKGRAFAASAVIATLPGMRFFHKGQFEGKRIHLTIQCLKPPAEAEDRQAIEFFTALLQYINNPVLHGGRWRLVLPSGRNGDESFRNILSWIWEGGRELYPVLINFSAQPASGWFAAESFGKDADTCPEPVSGSGNSSRFQRQDGGLVVSMAPWEVLLLKVRNPVLFAGRR